MKGGEMKGGGGGESNPWGGGSRIRPRVRGTVPEGGGL
jgi:hypothetical protein